MAVTRNFYEREMATSPICVPFEKRETVLKQGMPKFGAVVMATKGDFLAFSTRSDGSWRGTRFFSAPTLFGVSIDNDSRVNRQNVQSLSEGEVTVYENYSTKNPVIEQAAANDGNNLALHSEALFERNAYRKVASTLDYLTRHGDRWTPVLSMRELAALAGVQRSTASLAIIELVKQGFLESDGDGKRSFAISSKGLEHRFSNPLAGLDNRVESFEHPYQRFLANTDQMNLVIEIQQENDQVKRMAGMLQLLTQNGEKPTLERSYNALGDLWDLSRYTIANEMGRWISYGFVKRDGVRPRPFQLTSEGVSAAELVRNNVALCEARRQIFGH